MMKTDQYGSFYQGAIGFVDAEAKPWKPVANGQPCHAVLRFVRFTPDGAITDEALDVGIVSFHSDGTSAGYEVADSACARLHLEALETWEMSGVAQPPKVAGSFPVWIAKVAASLTDLGRLDTAREYPVHSPYVWRPGVLQTVGPLTDHESLRPRWREFVRAAR